MKLTKTLAVTLAIYGIGLAVSSSSGAQTTPTTSHGLSGKEVLDFDGSIVRGELDQQAHSGQPGQPAATAMHEQQDYRTVRRFAPPRTFDVMGIDASAAGGPVHMKAVMRWEGERYTVEEGSRVRGYVVTHIDRTGTDLVQAHGKLHIHVPRPALDEMDAPDVIETSVPIGKPRMVADAVLAKPAAPQGPVVPAAPAGPAPSPQPLVSTAMSAVPMQMQPSSPPGLALPPGLNNAGH